MSAAPRPPNGPKARPQGKAPPRPRPRRRQGRGALILIALMFATAGAIRLGTGVGVAMVRDAATAAPAAKAPAACPASRGLAMPLVKALKAREERVTTQEAALADRRQALALTERTVDRKLAELKAAEDKLAATLSIADSAAEKDVSRLTAVYAAMKPKQAAAVFEKMAPEFAAGFLGRMDPAAAAAILSGLTPERAYTVSVILAGRNAAAPRN